MKTARERLLENRVRRLEKLLKVESLNADAEELMDTLALEFDRNGFNLDQEGGSDFYGFRIPYKGIKFWVAVDLTTNEVRIMRANDCNLDVAVDLGFGEEEGYAHAAVWEDLIDPAVSESMPVDRITAADVRPMVAAYYNSLMSVAKHLGLTTDDVVTLFKDC